uniref:Uncharacterized protein n=1 Tax=Amphimedon queenslandica TaxID=400682 RepID=A0A1X7TFF0_AMPQE
MLTRNTDVTVGLVNGAIGTAIGIYATHISIKFGHIDVPCDIERGLHFDLCYLRIGIYIGNGFPLYFLMLLLFINVRASH